MADVTVTEVRGPAGARPAALCWAGDGKAFILADDRGLVRRLAADGAKEEARADLGLKATGLAPSAEGLLVTAPDLQQVLLLDAQTLKTKTKIDTPSVTQVVSVPSLSVAAGVGKSTPLYLIDLKAGKVAAEFSSQEKKGLIRVFDSCTVTPDGRFVFASNAGAMHRFRVGGGKFLYEDSSAHLCGGAFTGVACDNALVCMPCGGGNDGQEKDHPPAKFGQYYVYPVEDLHKPAFALTGPGHWTLALDRKRSLVFGTSGPGDGNLMTFNTNGLLLRKYNLGLDWVQQLVLQPQGEKLLVRSDTRVAVVDLPRP
jgi:hypothetical protein